MTNDTLGPIAHQEAEAAFFALQHELPVIKRSSENAFKNYRYADLESVWSAVGPVLKKNGFAVSQAFEECDSENHVVLVTTLRHVSCGVFLVSRLRIPVVKSTDSGYKFDAQAMGANITYGRRYALFALLGIIVEGEDNDAEPSSYSGRAARADTRSPEGPRPLPQDPRAMFVSATCLSCGLEDLQRGKTKTGNRAGTRYVACSQCRIWAAEDGSAWGAGYKGRSESASRSKEPDQEGVYDAGGDEDIPF
jgi:hypothetical protein